MRLVLGLAMRITPLTAVTDGTQMQPGEIAFKRWEHLISAVFSGANEIAGEANRNDGSRRLTYHADLIMM